MSGLTDLLSRVNSRTDEFLRDRLHGDTAVGDFTRDGRFNLGGLVALLSLGARERPRTAPAPADLSTLDAALVRRVLDQLHAPVTPEEAQQILDLLRTGAIASDVASALHVTLRFARRLPPELVIDLLQLPALPGDLIEAISEDVRAAVPRQPRQVLVELRDGRIDHAVLPHTLGVVLNRAAPRSVAATLRALIGPENRTVRLAILIYARAQGIDLDEDDLDALYQAIDPANVDLSPLLKRGLDRLLAESRGRGNAVALLRRLRA
jgi:hypothetical protein